MRNNRIALGLFHFNVQYVAGDLRAYHRYCTEAFIPFLEIVARHQSFRTSISIAGSGLEFIEKYYPSAIRNLKNLISEGKIELLLTTYTPSIWVAFPGRDLRKSIEMNRRCIAGMGLKASNIFFSQECFVGPGLSCLSDICRAVVYKDEYLQHFLNLKEATQFGIGAMRVAVGSNHLMNELARMSDTGYDGPFQRYTKMENIPRKTVYTEAKADTLSWRGYHID